MGIIDWIVKISEMRERGAREIDRKWKRKRGRGGYRSILDLFKTGIMRLKEGGSLHMCIGILTYKIGLIYIKKN